MVPVLGYLAVSNNQQGKQLAVMNKQVEILTVQVNNLTMHVNMFIKSEVDTLKELVKRA